MSQRKDTYLGFARHYDAHGWDWYARVYGPRLVERLRAGGLDGGSVLDAGCGTGTLSVHLAREGFRVTGVDLSEGMLAVAREKDPGGAVDWRRADIATMSLRAEFDAVVCVGDILNHFESIEDWRRTFARFHAHLRPGGTAFIDVMTTWGLSQHDVQTIQEKDDRTLILAILWEPAARRSTLRVTSFLPVPGTGLWERATETIPEWGQPAAEVVDAMRGGGFEGIERLYATSDDPERDERLVLVGQKLPTR